MKSNEKRYQNLKKKYSKKEIAENFYVQKQMTKQEKKESDEEIWEIRKKLRSEMLPGDKIYSGLLRLRYQIENYVENSGYDDTKSLPKYLKEYMTILNKKQKDLAMDLDIHKTRISRILNGRERINLQLAYRLEIHSGNLIPAILWWKLLQKAVEKEIKEDISERKKEKRNVKNIAYTNL